MRSVLFIGVGAPWSGGAGYLVRQNMLLRALAGIADELHLAMFSPQDAHAVPPFVHALTSLPQPTLRVEPSWRSRVKDLVSREPSLVRAHDCMFSRAAVQALQPDQFDAVVAYRCDFAYMAGVLDHPNLILDIDDPEHIRRADSLHLLDDGNPMWLRRLDLRRLRRFEIDCARRAKACFVCQPRDAEPFQREGVEPIIVPNCVDVPEVYPPRETAGAVPHLLFVANLQSARHSPNVDGLLWFLSEVWPLVRKQAPAPQCEFHIAGAIRGTWRKEAEKHEDVRVLGFIDDLPAAFRRAALTIAPIRFGTGTRIKILESMACGCPVVSTTKGCEGLEVVYQRDMLVADSPDAFAEACATLVSNSTLAERIGRDGWQAVSSGYDRAKRQQWLAGVFQDVIGEGKRGARRVA
jgi:glycosyltransferase involved in cell wall biosynthesis